MKDIDLNTPKGAIFSDDGKYRYALWRVWSRTEKPFLFIGLNPSTANQCFDDPTITRLMARASRLGYSALLAGNLYAFVSSNPDRLLTVEDAIGPENDRYLEMMIGMAKLVLCAWGSFDVAKKRFGDVLSMIKNPCCLGKNSDGTPKHPLYVSYARQIRDYEYSKK